MYIVLDKKRIRESRCVRAILKMCNGFHTTIKNGQTKTVFCVFCEQKARTVPSGLGWSLAFREVKLDVYGKRQK